MADQKTQLIVDSQDYVPTSPPGQFVSNGTQLSTRTRGWLKLRQSAHRFWILEAVASLLSLLVFAVIVCILLWYDNSIYGITTSQSDGMKRPHIFFTLAFLSAIMRATMLLPVATAIGQLKWSWFRSSHRLRDMERFDEAAGGILGSAKLIFTLRFRHAASIGAALTILALPLDALIQSAVLLPSKLVKVNDLDAASQRYSGYKNETRMGRAVTYNGAQIMVGGNNLWPDTAMVNAIIFGQSYSNGPSEIVTAVTKVDCPTGYCDFERSQTIAIDRHCVKRNDIIYVPGNASTYPYQTLPGTRLRYYLEGGSGFKRQYIVADSLPEWPGPDSQPPYPNYPTTEYRKDVFGWDIHPLIMRTSMLLDQGLGDGANATNNNGTYAAECALFWKIKTTHAYVNNSTDFLYGETVDGKIGGWAELDDKLNMVMTPNTCIVENRTVDTNEGEYYNNNCVYRVMARSRLGLRNMLFHPDFGLVGNLTLVTNETDANGRSSQTWNQRNLFTINLDRARHPNSTRMGDSIDTMWRNIAFTTTATMRQQASVQSDKPNKQLYTTGTVSVLVFYYSVDWRPIAMPALLVLCCALFVLYTAVRTRKEYAWRRSALPLLFHGLEDHGRLAQEDVRDFNIMLDIAKDMRVTLTEHVGVNGAKFTIQG